MNNDDIFETARTITANYKRGYDAGYLAGVNAAKAIFDKHFPPKETACDCAGPVGPAGQHEPGCLSISAPTPAHPDYCHDHGDHLRDSPACERAQMIDAGRSHLLPDVLADKIDYARMMDKER